MGPEQPDGSQDPSDMGEPGPPPAPREAPLGSPHARATVAAAPPSGRRRRRPARALAGVLGVLLCVTLGFVAGLAVADGSGPLGTSQGSSVTVDDEDAPLAALLEDVLRTEGVMLAFNDEVGERLEGARGEDEALALVGRAAAAGVGGLEALRPLIVAREGGPLVGEVRTVYLPHLDSWIDYLAAIADEPGILFSRTDQQPYILLINATAEAFRVALEDLLETGPSVRVAELADRILDDGFRSDGPEPTL